jgi:hypothetical protein
MALDLGNGHKVRICASGGVIHLDSGNGYKLRKYIQYARVVKWYTR